MAGQLAAAWQPCKFMQYVCRYLKYGYISIFQHSPLPTHIRLWSMRSLIIFLSTTIRKEVSDKKQWISEEWIKTLPLMWASKVAALPSSATTLCNGCVNVGAFVVIFTGTLQAKSKNPQLDINGENVVICTHFLQDLKNIYNYSVSNLFFSDLNQNDLVKCKDCGFWQSYIENYSWRHAWLSWMGNHYI